MGGYTLILTRNSPLRTTLVDEATGHAKYQIDTPVKFNRSVTRIRKLDPSAEPHNWDGDVDSDSSDEEDQKNYKSKKDTKGEEEDDDEGDETELPKTSDEIARIHWKWFSSDRIVFQGKATTRTEFLPKTGKMKGYVVSRRASC
jgi:hypothetical protein